ncbi:PARP12 [Symbiodinium sp. CCMP2456]|nr:PARP12 [Symbiodinium sp. CCMP2456]
MLNSFAGKYGRVESVSELVNGSARDFWCLFGSQKYNETGLVLASKYGHHEVVRVLVAAGSEIDYPANGGAALHWACKSFSQKNYAAMEPQQVATVQFLLGEGAQMRLPSPKSDEIYDALNMATQRGSVPMVMLLKAAGAEVSASTEAAAKKWGGAVSRALLSEEKDLDGDPETGHVRTSMSLGDLAGRLKTSIAELYLFHGTSPVGAKAISEQGFRRILAGVNAGTAFGRGCYFAEASSKSDEYAQPDSDGHFVMLLCRVVCGEMFRITETGFLFRNLT